MGGYPVNLLFGFGINGVKAFTKDRLIVYGEYGLVPAILYSDDAGNSFRLVYHSQFDPMALRTGIMDMVFPQNGQTGFAIDADRILKTTNGGLSWSVAAAYPESYFSHLLAPDPANVFAYSNQ